MLHSYMHNKRITSDMMYSS